MRNVWLTLIAGSLLLSASPAAAQQWVEYARGADDDKPLYYDPARVRFRGDVAIVWSRNDDAVPPLAGEDHRVSQMEIDCVNQTARTMYTAAYSVDGSIIGSDDVPTDAQAIPPGAMAEVLMNLVCRR